MSEMTPREIVQELDKHIIGQANAKRAVAIALRNRWRRMQVREDLRNEITPKNILMIGPTGVGKTEIARRLAKLANAPFIKVEATKFTEVGYVGRDVESIIRDLVDIAIKMTREQEMQKVRYRAEEAAEERMLDALLPRAQAGWDEQPEDNSHPGQVPQEAARRRAGRPGGGNRGQRRPGGRGDHGAARHGGDDQPAAEHVPEHERRAHQDAASSRSRMPSRSCARRKPRKLVNEEELKEKAVGQRGAERHRFPGRDRQGGQALRDRRRRRLPRGRAAGPAAADRRLHRLHQVRHGAHRPHPVHRLRRLPPVQALGSDPRAAGPPAHPRGAGRPVRGGLRPHPHRTRRLPDQAVRGAAGHRRRAP